jgi:fructose-specific phosphotransferase system IIC component
MSNSDPNVIMMKGALKPSLVVGVLGLIISTWQQGSSGLYGALLAQLVVLVFFLVNIAVASMTKNVDPIATMALAMFSYFSKILILGAMMFVIGKFTNNADINRMCFGLTAIALTFAWLGGEIRAYLKLKLHLPLPNTGSGK